MITTVTINQLKEAENITVVFKDIYYNDVEQVNAHSIVLLRFDDNGFLSKSIKPTAKEMTFDYLMAKVNTDKIYQNFCESFKKLLPSEYKNSVDIYPTSYGIGVFVLFNFRGQMDKHRQTIENCLKQYQIDFTTEYSNAGWVFRYKISKAKANIDKIINL